MALGGQIVDLRRLDLLDEADQVRRIRKIAIVQKEPGLRLVGIVVEVVDAFGVEGGGASLDTVDDIALPQQHFRQIGAVLTRDSGDQSNVFKIGRASCRERVCMYV